MDSFTPTDLLWDLMDSQQNNGGSLLAEQKQPRRSPYATMIRVQLAESGHVGKYDPRHVEGYMRLEHSTLDGLSARQFNQEIEIARQCVDTAGVTESELLAQSFGL
jgi:uncharacterized lipoprotein YmbA